MFKDETTNEEWLIESDEKFTVIYKPSSHFVEFKIYDIMGFANENIPTYEGIGGCGWDDKATEDIEKANTYIAGSVKWDGCSHYYFGEEGYIHLCGKRSLENLQEIIKKVYLRCDELMLGNTDTSEF